MGEIVTAKTVGFAIADEDQEKLNALVMHYGGGNRSVRFGSS